MFLPPPPDGWTNLEKQFFRETLLDVYKNIRSFSDKFVIIAAFEAGYTEAEIAYILGISQPAVSKKIKRIREELKKRFANKKL
jgi:predicted transcriptional regulator